MTGWLLNSELSILKTLLCVINWRKSWLLHYMFFLKSGEMYGGGSDFICRNLQVCGTGISFTCFSSMALQIFENRGVDYRYSFSFLGRIKSRFANKNSIPFWVDTNINFVASDICGCYPSALDCYLSVQCKLAENSSCVLLFWFISQPQPLLGHP